MLRALITFSLRFRAAVLLLAAVLTTYGFLVTRHANLDVFPNFVQPQVQVQTECLGLSPEQVELLVTVPIETTISGLGQMESLRSESIQGLSVISAVFREGTDIFRARQMLAENLQEVTALLPTTVKPPRLTPLTSSTMDLLKIGLVSDKLSPMELRTFADWTLKPRLLAVPGVAKCSSYGGEVRQLQIQVSPDRLLAYQLTLSDILAAARVSTGVIGAGFIETTNQRVTLQTENQLLTPEILGETVLLHTNGFSVRLKDVAQVVEAAEPKFGDARIQGRWGVLLTMSSQYGANTMEVTRSLESALDEMQPLFDAQGIKLYDRLHRPATFIETALGNMRHSLFLGAVLVAVVLFLMLGNVRTALISLAAIPLSLLTAVVVLAQLGFTINTITLGGLAIALGEVVDDSIIDVENIFRRLRVFHAASRTEFPNLSLGERTLRIFKVILDASLEVRSAVVYATFVVALVFLPVLALTGLQGSFFAPLALSYILAIMASLLVALTVTPALSFLLFGRGVTQEKDPAFQRWCKAGYARILGGISRWPRIVMACVAIACIAALAPLAFLGGELLPEFREGHFVLQIIAAPGTSLPEMLRMGERISAELLKNEHIDTVEQQVGRAELGEDAWGPNRSEFHVELKPTSGKVQAQMPAQLRGMLEKFPGIDFEVTTFLGDRISETVTGETAPVVVNIFGSDLDTLEAKAKEVAAVLKTIPGNTDVKVKSPPGAPYLNIRLRPERLTQLGFRAVEVLEAVNTAFQGTVVAQTYRGNQSISAAVILEASARQEPETIGALMLSNSQGERFRLSELADIYSATGRSSILHEGARRRQTVTCASSGRSTSAFVKDARQQVKSKINFPAGYYVSFTGTDEARRQAQHQLLLNSTIAVLGILLLLSMVLRHWQNLLLVLANIPFALAGGVLALWLHGLLTSNAAPLTLGSLVGFVTLFGITTRNTIMMLSHFQHLVSEEGMTWGPEAALQGAGERLMPILITAIVTALGLLPLALGSGEAGREIEGPMAIVILGGLTTSTLLNLLVLPTLSLRYGRFGTQATV